MNKEERWAAGVTVISPTSWSRPWTELKARFMTYRHIGMKTLTHIPYRLRWSSLELVKATVLLCAVLPLCFVFTFCSLLWQQILVGTVHCVGSWGWKRGWRKEGQVRLDLALGGGSARLSAVERGMVGERLLAAAKTATCVLPTVSKLRLAYGRALHVIK